MKILVTEQEIFNKGAWPEYIKNWDMPAGTEPLGDAWVTLTLEEAQDLGFISRNWE